MDDGWKEAVICDPWLDLAEPALEVESKYQSKSNEPQFKLMFRWTLTSDRIRSKNVFIHEALTPSVQRR